MKAITCSQCGALIGDVSTKQEFTECDYCNAKFRLNVEKVFEISRQEAKTINAGFKKPITPAPNLKVKPIAIILPIVVFLIIPVLVTSFIIFYARPSIPNLDFAKSKLKVEMSITAKSVVTSTSFDNLNFDTLNFDQIEFPKYDESKLPDLNADELIEKVFAERKINVEVKVDKKGNIIKAKAINGHQYLRKICEDAALKTTFFPPVNSDVTVIFLFSVKKR